MESWQNSDDFPFFYFQNPTSVVKFSKKKSTFHSKIVMFLINPTSLTIGGGPIWLKSTFQSFAGSFIWSYMLVNRIKSWFCLILKFRSPSGHITFWFSHYRAKKKVVVNPIYGCLNLSGEKYKCNEKRISSIGHTSEEKNPKNHPKMPLFWNFYALLCIGTHLSKIWAFMF